MEVTLTQNQMEALKVASVELKSSPETLVQQQVNDFADQLVYQYLLPVSDRLATLKAENERLVQENADLKAKLSTTTAGVVTLAP